MAVILVFSIGAYSLAVLLFTHGWQRAIKPSGQEYVLSDHQATVVIPARNEEATIGILLDGLLVQSHPPYEIIVVNDHSTDETATIVKEKMRYSSRISLLNLTDTTGKKRALDLGIRHAKSSIIVTTDADCIVGKDWLSSILEKFDSESVQMVIGGVRMVDEYSLLSSLQSMELAALVGSGAATLTMGFPTMSNGANLAFRKKVFEEVEGYAGNFHVASGDDEFLMRKVHARYPGGIVFNERSVSVVTTRPQENLIDFFYQRIRWASKWRSHRKPAGALLAIFVFLAHASVCMLWVGFFTHFINVTIGLSLLFVKACVEFTFLRKIMAFLNVPWRWGAFLIWQLIYSPYAVIFGLLANIRSYSWKGRKLQ